jgi:hypothetical protein
MSRLRKNIALSGGDKELRLFSGQTDAAGKFVVTAFDSGREGAIPGEYSVMIRSVKAPPGADELYRLHEQCLADCGR